MKITGGKVIGSGGFGCVFRPALKCKGKSTVAFKKYNKQVTRRQKK